MWGVLCAWAACLCACACACVWARGRRARALLAALPSYPRLPLLGHVHKLYGDNEYIYKFLLEISEKIEEHQKPLALWMGTYPVVIMSEPEDVKAVTYAFVEKPYYYSFGRVWLGDGLVTAPGAVWKRNIKKLSGSFSSGVVAGYQRVFDQQARRLLAALRAEEGRAPFDVMHKYLAHTTLEAICQTALGVADISESIVTAEYYRAFNRTLQLLLRRGLNLALHPEPLYRLTGAARDLRAAVAVLHAVSDTIMVKRKKEYHEMKRSTVSKETPENGNSRFRSFFDLLLELSETDPELTERQIRSEVDTIIVGGQETVATTLQFALLMLARHPAAQRRLHAELQGIFGRSGRGVCVEDLGRMRYCEALLLETLRLFPPVPLVMRLADRDLPLGKRYAMSLMKTVLAVVCRDVAVRGEEAPLRLRVDIALKPAAGHLLTVHSRHHHRDHRESERPPRV